MNGFYAHLGSLPTSVLVIFFGILGTGLVLYVGWARRPLAKTKRELIKLAKALESSDPKGAVDTRVADLVQKSPPLQAAWDATTRRVLGVGQGEGRRDVLLGTVADLWQPERLLCKHLNLPLFEAIPNIAVGVGLFFTFLFLTFALTDATVALTAAGAANPVNATKNLLSSAGGKFLSSLAGLAVSLLWTWAAKRALAHVQRACNRVVDAIEKRWPPIGAEAVVVEQLARLGALDSTASNHHATAEEQVGLTDELLVEAREQTGVLKRFETDLAVSIGKAVTAGFSPQMEQMTARLEKALTDLSDRMSTMNEDALRTMMRDFSSAISANTATEMEQFKSTLTTLSENLATSAGALNSGVEEAASQLGAAMQGMAGEVTAAASELAKSADGLDGALGKTIDAVKEIDATLSRAAALGAQGVACMEESLASATGLVDRMGEVGGSWSRISGDVQSLAARLNEASDGIEELAQEQHAMVQAVRSAGPEVLGAVSQMQDQLQDSVRSVAHAMDQVRTSMQQSSADLGGVVNTIKEGVVEYSKQVAVLHREMDAQMASAVNKLAGAIRTLEDCVGELTDSLEAASTRA